MFCIESSFLKQNKTNISYVVTVTSKGLPCISDKEVSSYVDYILGKSKGPACVGSLRSVKSALGEASPPSYGPESLPMAIGFAVILSEIFVVFCRRHGCMPMCRRT